VHASVLMPEPPVMLFGPIAQVSPVAGERLVVRVTESVKPLTGVIVIADVTVTPGVVLTIVGLANI